ncbi:Nucleolar pre-ribosomal-associated protein 1 [Cyphellophora attinorum]|uniref:Nucleolar pre-ribosomal-associated protein 1 n=1 Tax=Cyphellophora attinorum TaxID=1664694 RepID=A0A0N1H7M6_9EURO|nr:Nucleolar pre-ribosomal-associated protein 1 [Phialophora attinorum]KPI39066.1 Nucleolar pre-ribosomal-associated protein 1 [Phialophora attinorum]
MQEDGLRAAKRRKVNNELQHPDGDIRGAFELHNLLRFKQAADTEAKAGIERFRTFLVDVANENNSSEQTVLLKVLKQYCDDQSSSSKNQLDFSDLLLTWSFAAQSNSESVLSAVPAALAQFFRTINNELDFREFGLSLCHSLLKTDQVRLIERGLSAPKHKDFLISPCLRLLTEILSFDAGAVAANVFSRRDILFKRLDVLMDAQARQRQETDRRKPTVRRNAQRLLLAMLRYLDNEAKSELITQGRVLYSCVRNLLLDGGDIVRDVLKTFRLSLFTPELQKLVKSRFLNAGNLQLFAQLYDYPEEEADAGLDVLTVRQAVHEFLLTICTSTGAALIPQTGWYPPEYDLPDFQADDADSGIDLGLDSPYQSEDYITGAPVKNTNISMFLQKLSPSSDVLHSDLMLKTFGAAPELVADYFIKRPKPLGAPTDDNAWVGHFGFLYSIVELPLPPFSSHGDRRPLTPPPTSVVVESILPRPLDRATLTSFLKKNEDLTVISACRVVTVALQKLQSALATFKDGLSRPQLWSQAATRLTRVVAERVPVYGEIVAALQKTAKDAHDVRGTILECMAVYQQILPQVAAVSSFDPSPALLGVLELLRDTKLDAAARSGLEKQEIALVMIAGLSRSTKWWHKPQSDQLCLMMQLFMSLRGSEETVCTAIRDTVHPILVEKGVLVPKKASWLALTASLSDSIVKDDAVLPDFIENCMIRITKQPVKYLELAERAGTAASEAESISLIACAISEQWPFLLKNDDLDGLAEFVAKFFVLLAAADESAPVLKHFKNQMLDASESHKQHRKTLKKAFERQKRDPIALPVSSTPAATAAPARESIEHRDHKQVVDPFPAQTALPTTIKSLPPTYNIESDLTINPSTSRMAALIRSLSSPISEVRLGALSSLSALLPTLLGSNTTTTDSTMKPSATNSTTNNHPNSAYSESPQIHTLLGTLLETARNHTLSQPSTPIPSLITSLAATFYLPTLTDPSASLYARINSYLLRYPNWLPLTRILPYWIEHLLLEESDNDDHATEICQFLTAIGNGVLTPEDVSLCRRAHLFERLGSLYFQPGLRREVRKAVLRVFWVTAGIEGGADMLITRVGVRAWLDVVEPKEDAVLEMKGLVEALRARIEGGSDAEYIMRWEMGLSGTGKPEEEQKMAGLGVGMKGGA